MQTVVTLLPLAFVMIAGPHQQPAVELGARG
jgi:hypothetical protein